jgi:transcriptional regulator with XRE-family HTH domain
VTTGTGGRAAAETRSTLTTSRSVPFGGGHHHWRPRSPGGPGTSWSTTLALAAIPICPHVTAVTDRERESRRFRTLSVSELGKSLRYDRHWFTGGPGDPARRPTGAATARAWSLEDLARRTGVSRSTLSRLERGGDQPDRDAARPPGQRLRTHRRPPVAEIEAQPVQLLRAVEQAVWRDEASGFARRSVSPPYANLRGDRRVPASARRRPVLRPAARGRPRATCLGAGWHARSSRPARGVPAAPRRLSAAAPVGTNPVSLREPRAGPVRPLLGPTVTCARSVDPFADLGQIRAAEDQTTRI